MIVTLLRTIVLYILIIAGIRLLGKRQVGELEPTELVLALIIADLASVPMQDNGIPLLAGVIPIVTLLCAAMIMSVLMMRSIRFRTLMCGKPSIVVAGGEIVQAELRRNRLTADELLEELRIKGYPDLTSIRYAILETNGQLSVLPAAADRPLTAGQAGLSPPDGGLPAVLICDGRLLRDTLKARGYEETWLRRQLEARGIAGTEQVFLMTVDETGKTYLVRKEEAK